MLSDIKETGWNIWFNMFIFNFLSAHEYHHRSFFKSFITVIAVCFSNACCLYINVYSRHWKENLPIPFCKSRFSNCVLGAHAHTQTHLTANKVLSNILCSVLEWSDPALCLLSRWHNGSSCEVWGARLRCWWRQCSMTWYYTSPSYSDSACTIDGSDLEPSRNSSIDNLPSAFCGIKQNIISKMI